ncbi:MAG: tRNA (adenosine(37)-N6)-dimethylallyltransferase MiaA [Paracoccaceae bacterium]
MPPVLLAGPTASGKSALALALADALGAEIVNADSQQAYADWRVLTARPSAADEARAPHRLYGHLALDRTTSAGDWLRAVARILAEGRPAVIVGGTGLYFTALTEGLAPVPAVPPETRAAAEADLARLGLAGLADRLAREDPATARAIDRLNPARVLRAWEVWRATGRGLASWQAETPPALVDPARAACLVVETPTAALDAAIARRFDAMLAEGALDEARAVARRFPDPAARDALPGMRALGARELCAHVEGRLSLEAARDAAVLATRRYAKRQRTWMRNRLRSWRRIAPGDLAAALAAHAAPGRD